MIILCNGMPRSGSTWCYNVVCQLLESLRDSASVWGTYSEDLGSVLSSAAGTYDHLVIKSHGLDSIGRALSRSRAAGVIYTERDIYDAVASSMNMFGLAFEAAFATIQSALEVRRFHAGNGDALFVEYEQLRYEPNTAIENIARYLGLVADPQTIAAIGQATSLENMKALSDALDSRSSDSPEKRSYSPTTLLHRNHIRNGGVGYGKATLTGEQVQRIAAVLDGSSVS